MRSVPLDFCQKGVCLFVFNLHKFKQIRPVHCKSDANLHKNTVLSSGLYPQMPASCRPLRKRGLLCQTEGMPVIIIIELGETIFLSEDRIEKIITE